METARKLKNPDTPRGSDAHVQPERIMDQSHQAHHCSWHTILPGDPPQPCPELLTAEEAIRYLRLDIGATTRPDVALRRYRELGWLKGCRVGRYIRYRRVDLDGFLSQESTTTAEESR